MRQIAFSRDPKVMAEQLCLIHPSMEAGRYAYLWEQPCEDTLCEELFLFRHGAKLLRLAPTKWLVSGYYADGRDADAPTKSKSLLVVYRIATVESERRYYTLLVINQWVNARMHFADRDLLLVRRADAESRAVIEDNPPETDDGGVEFEVQGWLSI